jgi:hypothetical protein
MNTREMPFVRSDALPKEPQGIFTPDSADRWVDCVIPC